MTDKQPKPIDVEKALNSLDRLWALIMEYCPNEDDLHLVMGGYAGEIRTTLNQRGLIAQGWQTIETAPRDGTGILANWHLPDAPHASGIASVCFLSGAWYDYPRCSPSIDENYGTPTYWMPLPNPPKITKPNKETSK